jgi:arginyl-tRNA synthetase
LAYYLRDLAGDFHSYYNNSDFLIDDKILQASRLQLIIATKQVLQNGLGLLGGTTILLNIRLQPLIIDIFKQPKNGNKVTFPRTASRLQLIIATKQVLQNGLGLLDHHFA